MLKSQRLEIIKERVKKDRIVSLETLIGALHTSESTIRRDLEDLEKEGYLKRIHGGVQYINKVKFEPIMTTKLVTNHSEKERIGKYAASLVEDGDCIFLDAGSTTYYMIPYLAGKAITVVTNGISHIEHLITYNINSYIVCGQIKPTTKAILGEETIDYLQKYYFDKAFLGVNGISFDNGFSTADIKEASVKKVVMNRTKLSYFLADQSKYNQSYLVKIAELDSAVVISDQVNTDYEESMSIEVALS